MMTKEELFKELGELLKSMHLIADDCTYDLLNETLVIGNGEVDFCIGGAWVFKKVRGTWVLKQTIERPFPNPDDAHFGQHVEISQNGGRLTINSYEDVFEYDLDETGQFVKRN